MTQSSIGFFSPNRSFSSVIPRQLIQQNNYWFWSFEQWKRKLFKQYFGSDHLDNEKENDLNNSLVLIIWTMKKKIIYIFVRKTTITVDAMW